MFDNFDDDFFKNHKPFDDSFFKEFHERHAHVSRGVRVMDVLAPALSVLALVVLLALCCACCRRTRYSGRVLAPGEAATGARPHGGVLTATTTYVQAQPPYPHQPYLGPVAVYPVGQSAPYPPAGPYPPAAPYPTQQWAGGMPLPAPASGLGPTAPASDALPPSYEQVLAAAEAKHPPYNPNYPH